MSNINSANNIYLGDLLVDKIYLNNVVVYPALTTFHITDHETKPVLSESNEFINYENGEQ